MEDFGELFFGLYFLMLGAMVLAWFHLSGKLLAHLIENHPDQYEAMGRPNLLTNNTPKANVAFIRFIFGKRSSQLRDNRLVAMCRFLKTYFYAYACLFFVFFILVWLGTQAS